MLHDLSQFILTINTGYYWVYYPQHPNSYANGKILYHRLVMENFLNRYLETEEVIHHKDSNKLNNNLDNLELTTKSDHSRYHQTIAVSDDSLICELLEDSSFSVKAKHLKISLKTFYAKTKHLRHTIFKRVIKIRICPICLNEFTKQRKQTYCSQACSKIASHKTQHPSKDELQYLVWKMPTTHIGKLYGVSDKAVEKWCKKHNIEKPSRGYWRKQATQK